MTSLIMAFVLVLLASAIPLAAFGLDWEMAALVLLVTLLLWPIIALFRGLVGWLHGLLTGRRAP